MHATRHQQAWISCHTQAWTRQAHHARVRAQVAEGHASTWELSQGQKHSNKNIFRDAQVHRVYGPQGGSACTWAALGDCFESSAQCVCVCLPCVQVPDTVCCVIHKACLMLLEHCTLSATATRCAQCIYLRASSVLWHQVFLRKSSPPVNTQWPPISQRPTPPFS